LPEFADGGEKPRNERENQRRQNRKFHRYFYKKKEKRMIGTKGLPAWNNAGILPPIKPGEPGHSPYRSPYEVDLIAFIDVFSLSPDRIKILDGFLRFREALQRLGLTSGFQWLDGSFLENIETLENRSPGDMDVVTFFYLPQGESQRYLYAKAPDLFDRQYLRETYNIDGYYKQLGGAFDVNNIKYISYWYSMWAHRRNGLWKGFVQIDLSQPTEASAKAVLNENKEAVHE
jgi:hypothetical protein